MTDYYTKQPIKGTGTGGQTSVTQPKVQATLAWIRSFSSGAVLPPRSRYPCSHHVADCARQSALADGLLVRRGRDYIRTTKL